MNTWGMFCHKRACSDLNLVYIAELYMCIFFQKYDIRVVGGRSASEGRVEVSIDGGKWGVICSNNWGLREATVVCRHAGLTYASTALQVSHMT